MGVNVTNVNIRESFDGFLNFFKRLFKEEPLGAFGFTMTIVFLLIGIFASQLAPFGINETNTAARFLPPGSENHLLGTDHLGRDLLSRIIFGTRTSMYVGLISAIVSAIISTIIGVISGYFGGKLDIIIQRFVDSILCIPTIILIMVVISLLGSGMFVLILVIGVRSGIVMSRVIRSATINIRENTYIRAAVSIGCTNIRILVCHIIPNIMPDILIVFATRVPTLILLEAELSFLGFGVAPPTPSWGGMLSGAGVMFMFVAPWMVIWPGLALTIVIYSVNVFADTFRDLVDPKLRGNSCTSDFRLPSSKKIYKIINSKKYASLNN